MKLNTVQIKSFRGIPNTIDLSFCNKDGKPASVIILGDNGVGKSSIVDAIEFCLQGHVSQTDLKNEKLPAIISFVKETMPSVRVAFQNGEICERVLIHDEEGLLSNLRGSNKYFAISPFVLRRHDILRFIDSSDAERTLVFANYLRLNENDEWIENPGRELKRLQDERLKSKNERNRLTIELSKLLKVSPSDIPDNGIDLRNFMKEKIYDGSSVEKFQKIASKVNIKPNEKAIQLSESLLIEIANNKDLRGQIRKFSPSSRVNSFPRHLLPQLNDFLIQVGDKLTDYFLDISPIDFIDKFQVEYDSKNVLALRIKVLLKNGKDCSPQQILSEANLDLLALLFFVSFIQESSERGQAKFLILDDVLQSIDSTIRVSFISFILKRFSDWQFLITVHDKLWQRQLIELMNKYNHSFLETAIVKWSFFDGPVLKLQSSSLENSLLASVENGDATTICSNAGILLEEIFNALSVNLSTSIQRKKDDRYTLGDLWPGIYKQLKKTDAVAESDIVDKLIYLRNIAGAHFNEWAFSLSLNEAKEFAMSVTQLLNKVRCSKCKGWLTTSPALSFYTCRCGEIRLIKK